MTIRPRPGRPWVLRTGEETNNDDVVIITSVINGTVEYEWATPDIKGVPIWGKHPLAQFKAVFRPMDAG